MVFDSREEQGRYTGTIKLGEQSFTFTATERDGELRGTFESADGRFDFKIARQGEELNLATADTSYRLLRQDANPLRRSTNPLARTKSPLSSDGANPLPETAGAVAPSRTVPVAAGPQWKNLYRHESGASFRYPDGWQLREDANLQAAILIPSDGGGIGGETIMVSGADGQGVTSPDDPRVVQAIEGVVRQNLPFARRIGQSEPFQAGTRAAALHTWEASDLFGNSTQVRVYTTALGSAVLSVSVFGPKARVAARDAVARQIIGTCDAGGTAPTGASAANSATAADAAGTADPRLVGTWVKMEYKQVLSSSVVRYTRATLRADGTGSITTSGETSHTWGGSQSSGGYPARWRTSGGRLTISQAGEADDYRYQLIANSSGWPVLRLQPASGGKAEEWSKER